MRFGIVLLPQDRWAVARDKWRAAEQLGFDHAWTYDHLSWRSLADEPWGATVPTLTAAAAVTSGIRLGTFVSSPNFRHPVPFAKEIATLDDVSEGRFLLGIGSGGTGFDAFVLGQQQLSARQRHERFTEFVEALDTLLRFEESPDAPAEVRASGISLDGQWYTARDARMVGRPAQTPRVPFVVAANGPKGLALVSRFGQGWVTTGADGAVGEDWWNAVEALVRRLDDVASGEGRDPLTIDRYLSLDSGGAVSLASVGAFEAMVERAAALGFTDVITHWPRAEGVYAASEAVLEQVAARLSGWR
ncbi:LLM class flavin-dependent oxidoreductase [Subtercola boreus]|uniref:Luciferase n=1 Tax=Subtercola boreus TaxID=120213 RepID=A0A3E0WCW9_9MICO|nr:LLM class flavin-dependent oxidoreductase [Subtercola boreus]RFA22400.1 luciferase [Subtercola boreus]RFA22462.1 luciferase [Subtercola boreus]RFA28477.1 luciferase [Subtercola boreus]